LRKSTSFARLSIFFKTHSIFEMKKIFTLLFALVMVSEGFSQTYYNWDFTTVSTFPAGFVTWNLDGQTANTTDWTPAGQALFNAAGWDMAPAGALSNTSVAATTSDFNAAVACDRWLVTPQINVPAATPNVVLQWVASSLLGNYPDSYEVLVSTTDSATTSFHTILLGVTENPNSTTRFLPLSAYAGQTIRIAFRDTTTNGFALLLNSISVINLPSYALHTNDVEIYEHNYLNNPVQVTGLMTNNGFDTINSFVVNYSVNGGAVVSSSPASGAGIVPIGISGYQYFYNHPTIFNPTTAGTYTIAVWFTGLNGTGAVSDTATVTIFYYPKVAGLVKKVLVEELTGAGCIWCPGGALMLRDLVNKDPHIVPVAIHSADINGLGVSPADAMQIADGETVSNDLGLGFPEAMMDRLYAFDNQAVSIGTQTADGQYGFYVGANTYNWDTLAAFRYIQATPVNVTLTNQIVDTIGGTLTATVNATFLQSLSQGTYNLNLYVVEDSVLTPIGNNGNGYNQANGYSSQATGGGVPQDAELHNLPLVITDNGQPNNWAQNHVLRAMAGGPWGASGIIPSAPVAGTTYSDTFTTTLPSTWRYKKVYLVGVVQEYSWNINLRTVLNVVSVPLDLYPTGIVETSEFNKLSVYPNPASTMATVLMDSKANGLAGISVLNTLGQTVIDPTSVLLNTGSQSVNIPVGGLSSGLYFVKVTLNGEVSTLPLSIMAK
jgi:hypothetical protein